MSLITCGLHTRMHQSVLLDRAVLVTSATVRSQCHLMKINYQCNILLCLRFF